ncbi:MAG: glycosyltransferase [bacterium]
MGHRIDQILAGFAEGDAISNEAVILQGVFRKWGLESDIFVDSNRVSPAMRAYAKGLEDYSDSPDNLLIHHYSIGCEAADLFCRAKAKKIAVYHNITPAGFFDGFDDSIAARLRSARDNLRQVIAVADAIWAVSRFDAAELEALGAKSVKVFPLLFSAEQFNIPPDPDVFKKMAAPLKNILCVGRIAPNKCIEDLILAFSWYYWRLNRNSRLIIVGSERTAPRYYLMLRMLVHELDVPNVCFERFASPAGLSAYYDIADVFVSASRHEGYCLPLVEAMSRDVPVIARNTGGIPEALGGAGVMYDDASPEELAQLIHRVINDGQLKQAVLTSQKQRMKDMSARSVESELKLLLSLVDGFTL